VDHICRVPGEGGTPAGSHSASLSSRRAHKAKALASQKAQLLQTHAAALTTPPCYVALGKQMRKSREIQQRHRPHSRPCPPQPETRRGTSVSHFPECFSLLKREGLQGFGLPEGHRAPSHVHRLPGFAPRSGRGCRGSRELQR